MPLRSLVAAALTAAGITAAGSAAAGQEAAPRIDAVTPLAKLSTDFCVCGHFPTPASAAALRIAGRPLTLAGPFNERMVSLRPPPGLAPGRHMVTGAPEAGFSPDDRREIRLVAINTKVCRPLPFGPRRRLHLVIAGTEEPVELRLRNLTPALLSLAGGPLQERTTSGGRHNQALVAAQVAGAGRWTVEVELAEAPCPCSGAGRGGIEPERQGELAEGLADSLSAVESWFRRAELELRVAAQQGFGSRASSLRLVAELERRLLEATKAPELAALRAWVEDRLAEERALWLSERGLGNRAPPLRRPGPALARLASAVVRQEAPAPSTLDEMLQRLRALFETLREVSENLVIDLCVRSLPTRSEVWIQPKRYEPGRRTELTDTAFENLTRGVYTGGVARPDLPPAEFTVDLVSETGIYIECDLEDGLCDQPSRPAGFVCRREGGR